MTELSERNHTVAYELIRTESPISVSSLVGDIRLSPVTDVGQTFMTWSTEYANDVDSDYVGEARTKKREMFAAIKTTLTRK